jgi:hypothetical protein
MPFRPHQSQRRRAHQENRSCNQLFQQPASAVVVLAPDVSRPIGSLDELLVGAGASHWDVRRRFRL